LKNFTASAAQRLRLFLIGGDGSEIFKIFTISAATALFFSKKIGGDGGSADRLTPLVAVAFPNIQMFHLT
jgi:hypothetical protein